jgi:nicotinate dehydrogenase subunit A
MASRLTITVNGRRHRVKAAPDTPLLYVLRNELRLLGPRFGCGLAQCGACTVHFNGEAVRSCITPVSAAAAGVKVTTLEGLGTPDKPHPVQQAFIDEQASQCGYCQNGFIMTGAALLKKTPRPTDKQVRTALASLQCRCGTHMRYIRAVKRAAGTKG